MTITEMLGQSGILTVLGMGVVFAFLVIMIGAMNLLHAVIHALGLDVEKSETAVQVTTSAPAAPVAESQSGAVIAAIAAALHDKQ